MACMYTYIYMTCVCVQCTMWTGDWSTLSGCTLWWVMSTLGACCHRDHSFRHDHPSHHSATVTVTVVRMVVMIRVVVAIQWYTTVTFFSKSSFRESWCMTSWGTVSDCTSSWHWTRPYVCVNVNVMRCDWCMMHDETCIYLYISICVCVCTIRMMTDPGAILFFIIDPSIFCDDDDDDWLVEHWTHMLLRWIDVLFFIWIWIGIESHTLNIFHGWWYVYLIWYLIWSDMIWYV